MYLEILRCGVDRWTSVWGDPLVTGLIIMGLFLVAAALCAGATVRSTGREKLFWAFAAAAALVFAANVHLDLHVLPKSIGHCMARAQGWYDQREVARAFFVACVAISTAALMLTVVWIFWWQLTANIIVTLGFALTGGVQAAKGFGRHGWDRLYDVPFGPFRLPDLPDMIGAALVIIGAALALRRLRGSVARGGGRAANLP